MKHLRFILILICLSTLVLSPRQGFAQLSMLSTAQGLPNSMVHQVVQDADGFIWIATYYGLYRYDGFEYKAYKSNESNPNYLLSNNVVCLAFDHQDGVWIGTHNGLGRLDKLTNEVRNYKLPSKGRQRINHILPLDDRVYVATIRGLATYDSRQDSLRLLDEVQCIGDVPVETNMQALCRDDHGDILMATWGNGLFRFIPTQNRYIHYTDLDGERFFRSIYRDSQGHTWAISHGGGLFLLNFSPDQKGLISRRIRLSDYTGDSQDDYILSILEDKPAHRLWLGT